MSITTQIHQNIRDGKFDRVDDEWLELSAQEPLDLKAFVGIARALSGAGEQDRARLLLDLLDEQLTDASEWQGRLYLLRRAGEHWIDPDSLHPEIIRTLEQLYADKPSLSGLVEVVGLHRAIEDLDKKWAKIDKLIALLPYDLGAYVSMEGKGSGTVGEVNFQLKSFKVDLDSGVSIRVGFSAAPKLLNALTSDHILRRKLENPAQLVALRDEDPPALLRETLSSFERALTAAEIRDALRGVVEADQWSSWWAAARRHPQVLTSTPGGHQRYTWAASETAATEGVLNAFTAADTQKKLILFKKNHDRDETLREEMVTRLIEIGTELAASEPSTAITISFILARSGVDTTDLAWSPEHVILEAQRPLSLISGISQRALRLRAYEIARQRHDWIDVYAGALRSEEDPGTLSPIATELKKHEPARLAAELDRIVAHPKEHPPTLVWIAEQAAGDETFRQPSPFRLLKQILQSFASEDFSLLRPRLTNMLESGGTIPHLLSDLSSEEAPKAREILLRTPLEEHDRKSLLDAILIRFPELDSENTFEPLHATLASIEAKRKELTHIMKVELPENRTAIQVAREMGDLRENFEYKAARQRHEYLSARATSLNRELERAQPIDPATADLETIRVGTRAVLVSEEGDRRDLTILGPWESQPEEGVISYESEIAIVLIGKRVGEQVDMEKNSWTVESIEAARI